MKFGIELELWSSKELNSLASDIRGKASDFKIERSGSLADGGWSIITDASLYGGPSGFHPCEIVSPILDTNNPKHMQEVRKLCAALQTLGCRVDSHCGLHVHVDTENLTVDEIKSVFSRYSKFEEQIDSFMPQNRRGDIYYARSGKGQVPNVMQAQTKIALGRVLADRFMRVNLCAIQRHGTIEFRQHSGSVNADTILNWVQFIEQFVTASKTQPSASSAVVRPRGRRSANVGIASGCRKVYDLFMAEDRAGRTGICLDTISARTGLAVASVKVAISQLKNKHGIRIRSVDYRGCLNPRMAIMNPTATLRLTTAVSRPVVRDSIWRGIDAGLQSFYMERAAELNGFAAAR